MKKQSIILAFIATIGLSTFSYADNHATEELSKAAIVNPNMGMGQTMRIMGKTMGQLGAAKTTQEMVAPAQLLADYTSQSEALTEVRAPKPIKVAMTKSMYNLRKEIVKLQSLIAANDLEGAKEQVKAIGAYTGKAHAEFKEVYEKSDH